MSWKKVSEGLENNVFTAGLVIKLQFPGPGKQEHQREVVIRHIGGSGSLPGPAIPFVHLPVAGVSVAIPLESLVGALYMIPDPFERWWENVKRGMPDLTCVTAGPVELARAEKLARHAFFAGIEEGSHFARTEAGK